MATPEVVRTTVELSESEVKSLISMTSNWKKRAIRQRLKSTFVPEPGKRHAGDAAIEKYDRLLNKLREAERRLPKEQAADGGANLG